MIDDEYLCVLVMSEIEITSIGLQAKKYDHFPIKRPLR